MAWVGEGCDGSGRHREKNCAKREFNLCPMCGMPLYTTPSLQEDLLWGLIQLVFKGKPAFNFEADGYKKELSGLLLCLGCLNFVIQAVILAVVRIVITSISQLSKILIDLITSGAGIWWLVQKWNRICILHFHAL